MNLCKYKHIFGEPNTGLRKKYRIFGISLIDLIPTLLAAWLLSYLTKQSIWLTLLILFVFMLFMHRLFCVRTTTDKLFFPDTK